MADGQKWMGTQHARAGITHDLLNLLSALGFVAMHQALGAGWFVIGVRTFRQPRFCIGQQVPAGMTKFGRTGLMTFAAIQMNHRRDGLIF